MSEQPSWPGMRSEVQCSAELPRQSRRVGVGLPVTENPPAKAPTTRHDRRRITAPPPSIIWAFGCVLAAVLVYVLRDLVLIVLLSVTLAYLINPIVKIAESAAIKREVAVAGVYVGISL